MNTTVNTAFFSHLLELRLRLLYIFFSFFFTFLVSTFYCASLTHLICIPFSLEISSFFIFTELTEGLYASIYVSFISAFYFSFPYVIYQLYSFLIPSCYQREKKEIDWILFSILLLFFISVFFACQFVLPSFCSFLQEYQYSSKCIQIKLQARIAPAIRWSCTAFFLTTAFFQLPILGQLFFKKNTSIFLIRNRKNALFFLLLVASFFSPPDVSIQCALAIISFLLYEFFIWYAAFNECWQKKSKKHS